MGMFGGMARKPVLGGYDQGAAMMGQSGFAPMNADMPQKKPGFFSKQGFAPVLLAGISDFFARRNGVDQNMIGNVLGQRQYEASLLDKARQAEMQRQQEREDYIWKSEYDRANPKPANNDTINDFNWYKGLSDADKAIYQQMKPEYRQGPDGRFYRVDTATGPMPTFTADDWEKGQPLGGSVGNGAGGF